MNYLDYPRHDDRAEAVRLRDELGNLRSMMNQRMMDARFWRDHDNPKRVANSLKMARRESRKAQDTLRKLRELEAQP